MSFPRRRESSLHAYVVRDTYGLIAPKGAIAVQSSINQWGDLFLVATLQAWGVLNGPAEESGVGLRNGLAALRAALNRL